MIAIVEDEAVWSNWIIKVLTDMGYDSTSIKIYQSGQVFITEMQQYDIVFLDVDLGMNEPSGLEVCSEYKSIYPSSYCMILTSHIEFGLAGYKSNAYRYIDKQFLERGIAEAMESISYAQRMKKTIKIHILGENDIEVAMENIIYVETYHRNIVIHVTGTTITSNMKLSELLEQLNAYGFYMPHKSYIINLDYVKNYNRHEIILKNNDTVLLGRNKYLEFTDIFLRWKMKRTTKIE